MRTKHSSIERDLVSMHPKEYRNIIRQGEDLGVTAAVCQGYAQAQLVIVPKEYAFDFLLFCNRNPKPCPVIDVTDPGSPHPLIAAPEADLRTDVSRYSIYIDGKLESEPTDIKDYWRDDLVAFLLGCSFSFDWVLRAANIRFRMIGVYTSNMRCIPAGRFSGPLIVSCRLVKGSRDAVRTVQISSRYPATHGAPVHVGDPTTIGIRDLHKPDMFTLPGPLTPKEPDETALFWACAVTPRAVAVEAKLPLMILGAPGRLFLTDLPVEELAVLS